MALFDNGEPEEILFFIRNFQMNLKASGMLDASAKINYIHTLLRGEALRQLDTLYVEVGGINTTHLNHIILGLGMYIYPINAFFKIQVYDEPRNEESNQIKSETQWFLYDQA